MCAARGEIFGVPSKNWKLATNFRFLLLASLRGAGIPLFLWLPKFFNGAPEKLSDEIAFQNSSIMMDSENRASSPRFQSSKTILRSLNADFRQQCKFSESNEYKGISKVSNSRNQFMVSSILPKNERLDNLM